MKTNSTLLLLGGAAVIGIASYLIYSKLNKPQNDTTCNSVNVQSNTENDLHIPSYSGDDLQPESDFSTQKQITAKNICERHDEAGKVFNELLNSISDGADNTAYTITENSEQLNEIGNDLDDLLN